MPLVGLKDAAAGVYASYLARFTGQDPRPAWLHELRQSAFARFSELGFPTVHQEGWRQTNPAPITGTAFEVVAPPGPRELVERLRELELPGVDWSGEATRLVFVNGMYAPGLSSLAKEARGCRIGSLAPLATEGDRAVRASVEHEDELSQPFVQLNAAFLSDGAFIEIPAGKVLERPVAILQVTVSGAAGGGKGMAHPRTVVLAGRESQAAVVETFVSLGEETSFTNAVTSIEVGENARLEYTRIGQEGAEALHVAKLRSRQLRDSRFQAHSIQLGGKLTRNNVHAILDGEGAECVLNGLYTPGGRQHVDNSTILDHAKPLGTSREYYKGVLDGQAVGVFNGRIIVRKDAQHTDAIQSNKNLLLSEAAATASSQPQLEIYADDVRCTHGATVGQLDAQALFYLRSRGLGLEESRKLLVYAFAADVLGRIGSEELRGRLEAALWKQWAEPAGAAGAGRGTGE